MRLPDRDLPDLDPSDPPFEAGFFRYFVGLVGPLVVLLGTVAVLYQGRLPGRRRYGVHEWVSGMGDGMLIAGLNA